MLTDLHMIEDGQGFEADVCIIGAGVAGILMARRFAATGVSVCLVESGGATLEAAAQELNRGENVGLPYYALDVSRNRGLGGTSNTWSGRCVPLDPIDFERRKWVPHSGWPVKASDLGAFYRQAAVECGVGEADPESGYRDLWEEAGIDDPGLDPEQVEVRFWRLKAVRFGDQYKRDLIGNPNVQLLLHGTAVEISVSPDTNRVESILLAGIGGRRHRVRARHFVLAAGGIENARLMLASTRVERAGIGNAQDMVGRFFMEHPKCRTAEVRTDDPYRLLEQFRSFYPRDMAALCPSLVLSAKAQETHGVLNSSIAVYYRSLPSVTKAASDLNAGWKKGIWWPEGAGRNLLALLPVMGELPANLVRRYVRRRALIAKPEAIYLLVRGEQAPNPDSRVTLSDQIDGLGYRRARLDWRLSDIDKRSARVLTGLVGQEFQRLGLGRTVMDDWLLTPDGDWPTHLEGDDHHEILQGGHHHIGTTRMSTTPRQGVVDRDCRVWGKANLHIAGSSVFPTAGWANPTLTIAALALRLADHVGRMVQEGDMPVDLAAQA
ncbi:GMC oxidoreductase [Niveispirillum irakense]|uniref:GMC oxidoreductase n=1 Tax=Niveispirillum irakense TaxID=34011 RepID=UPI0003F7945B|nr:GMC family oxidoreductase [Niveispirillum irakense]